MDTAITDGCCIPSAPIIAIFFSSSQLLSLLPGDIHSDDMTSVCHGIWARDWLLSARTLNAVESHVGPVSSKLYGG
jgi:hypothetical protein